MARVVTLYDGMPMARATKAPTFLWPMTSTPATGPTVRLGQSGVVALPPGRLPAPTFSATERFSLPSTLSAALPLERSGMPQMSV